MYRGEQEKMKFYQKPSIGDLIIALFFTVLITAQPFFLHQEIVMLDTGNHLPALNALLHGQIPYRDFLFWRGPLDLYIPALLMKIGGAETAILSAFFYVGSVLTLMVGVLLAWQIFKTRLVFYLMVPVFVARTFPRISYYYWGGFRYFIGFVALLCAIQGFKKQKPSWMFAAGVVSCLCWLTTIEAGASTILAILCAMALSFKFKVLDRGFLVKSFRYFVIGGLLIFVPYVAYLWMTHSFFPYLDITLTVPKFLTTLMDARGRYPETFWLFLYSLIPGTKFFTFMTPFYCYIALFIYFSYRIRKHRLDWEIPVSTTLGVYGLVLFFASFRMIEGHHFEMALQPEKILLFFLIEKAYLFLLEKKDTVMASLKGVRDKGPERLNALGKVYAFRLFVVVLIGTSLGYSFGRYNHRFTAFKLVRCAVAHRDIRELSPLRGQETRTLNLERVKNMTLPRWQADEIEGVVGFLKGHTKSGEAVFFFPEVGNFAFWADRPFVGRFAIGTSSWVDERWHQELVAAFKKARPRYVVMTHIGHRTFPAAIYFRYPKNILKFKEVTKLILDNYSPIKSFESVAIYQRKE